MRVEVAATRWIVKVERVYDRTMLVMVKQSGSKAVVVNKIRLWRLRMDSFEDCGSAEYVFSSNSQWDAKGFFVDVVNTDRQDSLLRDAKPMHTSI